MGLPVLSDQKNEFIFKVFICVHADKELNKHFYILPIPGQ